MGCCNSYKYGYEEILDIRFDAHKKTATQHHPTPSKSIQLEELFNKLNWQCNYLLITLRFQCAPHFQLLQFRFSSYGRIPLNVMWSYMRNEEFFHVSLSPLIYENYSYIHKMYFLSNILSSMVSKAIAAINKSFQTLRIWFMFIRSYTQ